MRTNLLSGPGLNIGCNPRPRVEHSVLLERLVNRLTRVLRLLRNTLLLVGLLDVALTSFLLEQKLEVLGVSVVVPEVSLGHVGLVS